MGNALALGIPRGFRPTQIKGCKLWLAADRIFGLADADPVGTWLDKSGQHNDAVQATPAAKPTYKVNIVNGRPVIRFDGTDDVMSFSSLALTAASIFVVGVSTRVANGSVWLGHDVDAGSFVISRVGDTVGAKAFASTEASVAGDDAVWHIAEVSYAPTSLRTGYNGTLGTAVNTSNTLSLSRLGYPTSADFHIKGDVAEIILYNRALGHGERRRVNAYLGRKYGISV